MIIICKICKKLYESTDEILVTLCGHLFHKNCLNFWINDQRKCPQCHIPCSSNNFFKVEFYEMSENHKLYFNNDIQHVETEKLQLNKKKSYTRCDNEAVNLHLNEITELKFIIDSMNIDKKKSSEELNRLQNQLNLSITKYEKCDEELVKVKEKFIELQTKYEFLIEKTKVENKLEISHPGIEIFNLKEKYEKKLQRAQQEINELHFLNLALAKETFTDPRSESENEISGL